ncbi:MAG TPA: arginine--tRNA ligase [Planctomycetes bacterium]|nr:arginine--tRNA ligase [Planctomycetota bacterium]HIL36722.1 arginine--tRNA ligase [Planctomycetota bacterium]
MQAFTDAILTALAQETSLAREDLKLETPRNPELGDFAFPCFPLAKTLRKAPPKIAQELAEGLAKRLEGIEVQATGPYLNFRIDRPILARSVIESILKAGDTFGHSQEGAGKTIVIDLSSPNIAKPMSVGHLRSTVIGAAIQRLHDALGYTTVGINHIGDWGSQFGKLIAALDRWGEEVDLDNDPIPALLKLYVRYHEEEEADPTLKEAAAAAFRELESGVDGPVRAVWRKMTALSLSEFDRVYARLGVTFDEVRGEAFYESYLDQTVQRVVDTGITEESEGALVVSLKQFGENLPPCILRKTDGTTLYATRDLAAVFHRWELYSFERCLYVVGGDQRLHFRQLKHVLDRMGLEWEPRMEHIDFGMVRLPEGRMSTRHGKVVFLQDVLDEASRRATEIIKEKNVNLTNPEAVGEMIGMGAVVFNDLKRERVKDIAFTWEEVLAFEGDTGPYVQYTHARLSSIGRKAAAAGEGSGKCDFEAVAEDSTLILELGRYPNVLVRAAAEAEPSLLTQYLLGLSRMINSWIAQRRVLGQEEGVTSARLALANSCKVVVSNGLGILGVPAPTEM